MPRNGSSPLGFFSSLDVVQGGDVIQKFFRSFKLRLILLLILVFFASVAQAVTITSANSGYWNDTGTWVGNVIPTATDSAVISSGHTVLFDRNDNSTTCGAIEIKNGGILKFDSGAKTMQVKGDINVYGKLELVPGSTLKIECETNGQYGIIVQSGGELKGAGSVPTVLTTLSAPLAIGSQTIIVVNASGFGVGDIITLGDGANAEGFTISAISGNQITINRKAINAQEAGAEVYKNATVTTSGISPGSKTFTVADLGGIKAGDSITVATTAQPDWTGQAFVHMTEIQMVGSVNASANSITLIEAFSYAHNSGAMVAKNNRDAVIAALTETGDKNSYINLLDNSSLDLKQVEVKYADPTINSLANISRLQGDSFHHNANGLALNDMDNAAIVSSIFFKNDTGLKFNTATFCDAAENNLISNITFLNKHGVVIEWGKRNLLLSNYSFSNEYYGYTQGVDFGEKNVFYANSFFSNLQSGLRLYNEDYSVISNNTYSLNQVGVKFDTCGSTTLINDEYNSNFNSAIFIDYNVGNHEVIDSSFINNKHTVGYFVGLGNYPDKRLFLKNCLLDSVSVGLADFQRNAVVSLKHNKTSGISKVWGAYDFSSGTKKFNYSDQTYAGSVTIPILFRGSNHTISVPETGDGTAATEVWFVTYRALTSNWEVKGTVSGLQSNRATSGLPYTSDNGQVKLTITQNNPKDGDQFIFAAMAAAGDANTQKKIIFGPSSIAELNNQSRLIVKAGGKVELIGTADKPTLIDYDGAGGYGFVISGEVDAQYFDFNQINSDGVKIDPTATITKFDNGSIRNVSGLGPHLSVNDKDHTFNYLNFDNTGAYDVKTSNDADLVFVKSQRGTFSDSISDTASVSWDGPVPGYVSDYVLGTCTVNPNTGVVTIPFKIKDPNGLNCTFKSGSAQYKVGENYWRSIPDPSLSGIDGTFGSAASWDSAPVNYIYWSSKDQLGSTFEGTSVKFRFRVNNGYVYEDYGSSEKFIVDFVPPTVAVISPNGGEYWIGGSTHNVTWTAADNCSGVKDNSISIYYSTGEGYNLIAANEPNDGVYNWTLPVLDSTTVKIKIIAVDNAGGEGNDESDAVFTIDSSLPIVAVVSPNGGESWVGGSTHDITWTASDNFGLKGNPVAIYYSTGEGYIQIASNEPNDGVYNWTLPVLDSATVKIKITAEDKAGNIKSDESDSAFTIDSSLPTVAVVSPNGSESWVGGSTHDITWTASDNFGLKGNPVSVYYSTGEGYIQIASNEPNDGVYNWTLPVLDSATVKIKVTAEDKAGNSKGDESDAVFTIDSSLPIVGVVSPNGGESWIGGSTHDITWMATDGASGIKDNSVAIYYSTGGDYTLIANNEPNDGIYGWTLPQIDSTTVRIKITAQDNVEKAGSDESDAAFTIDSSAPSVSITLPNGGETLAGGLAHEVTWTATDNFGLANNPVSIYYSTGEGYDLIASNEPNDGTYSWVVPKMDSNTARVKIIAVDKAGNNSFDESDLVFKISVPPSATLLSPNGGEKIEGNLTYNITWIATDEGGGFGLTPITIMYSTNGTDWNLIAANQENSGSYGWKVPKINSSSVRVKIEAADQKGNIGSDASDSVFMVDSQPPALTLSSPNGGELFRGGTSAAITWLATDEGSGIADNSIALYYNAGANDVLIADNLANTGSYGWTVPKVDFKQVKIKITTRDNVGQGGEDWSDNVFEIDSTPPTLPSISSVISPTPLATQLLSGTKSSDSKYIYVNGSREAISYPDNNSWSCPVNLVGGKNTFEAYAQDAAGNNSAAVMATIEVGNVTFSDGNSPAQVKFPVGSVTEEVSSVSFSYVTPPLGPMRGAVAAERPVKIMALAGDQSPIGCIQNPIEIILPVPSGASDPRVYFWNADQEKWECLPAAKIDDKFKFSAAKLGIFAVFDVIDKKGPTISNFKVNGRRVTTNDSIPDQPEISVDISDDYGIDVGVLALSVDNQVIRSLSDAVANGTFKYLEKGPFSVGSHTFVIVASDEVGNSSTFSETLYVIGSAVSGLMVYPNPYTLGGTLKFDGLSGDVNVYIYDIAADLAWKGFTSGAASISWDGKNHAGNTVAPGVYFYVVKDTLGNKTTGKIAVIK